MGDIEDVFINPEEFGEPATYVYEDGTEIALNGIFDNDFISVDPGSGAPVQGRNPRFVVPTAKLPKEPTVNDHVIVRGINYRVIESQPDGTGLTDLFFQHNSHKDLPIA